MANNYHMTEDKYLESILVSGLTPQQGIRSNLIGDEKKAVFYSKGYEGVIAMFFMMLERYEEYIGSEGDIHISSYEMIKDMIESRKEEGRSVSDYLLERFDAEKQIVEMVNFVRGTSCYQEFLGEGVCLKLGEVEDINEEGESFYNSWTNSVIPPSDLLVLVLEDRQTLEICSSKYDILDYFMGLVSLDDMRECLYDDESKELARSDHSLWKIMAQYYEDNHNRISELSERYRLREMPIAEYCSRKSFVK